MKRLTLLRHAKSGWDDPVARDFDRPLNAKGRRAARVMGRHMRDAGLSFDLVIASPATRVAETLDELWSGYGRSLSPSLDKRIYLASSMTLLDLVQEAPDSAESILMSGHNPGMEDLILMLAPENDEDESRNQIEEKFPTASLAELQFETDRWGDIRPGTATIARFVRPRDLDPTLGPEDAA